MRALFLQEIKTFFKSPSSIFIFVIPLILLVGLGYFIPAAYIIPSTISVGIVGAVLLYFGGGLEEIKRTSFLKVMGTTKLNKVTTLIVKMSFAAIVSMVTVIWVLGLGYLFSNVIPFLATDFGHLDDSLQWIPGKVKWNQVQWFILFYASALSLCVTLALAFCFAAIAKSSLSFYLLTFGYIAALILFGGVIMPGFLLVGNNWFHWFYYLIPNYYSGNQLTAAFNSGLSKSVYSALGFLQDFINGFVNFNLVSWIGGIQIKLTQSPEFVQMWNDMNDALQAEFGIKGPDFSDVDVDEQFKIDDLFFLAYQTSGIWSWKLSKFLSEIFNKDITIHGKILIENIVYYGNVTIKILTSATLNTVKALIGSMEYSKAFDFTNTKSIIDVFMPYVWIAGLAGISAWKFEWVN